MKREDLMEFMTWDDAPTNVTFKKDNECSHEWVKYTGLNETFWYCKKCDKKDEKRQ